MMVRDFLGPGLKGLLVVSFLAAFMSTIDTHLNWGASYLVHDLYARFIKPDEEPRHYVRVSQLVTLILMVLAVLLASQMKDISTAWEFLMSMGAGAGLVLLMRWFWWRINAWSELTAMASSIGISFGLEVLALWQHRGQEAALIQHHPELFGLALPYHLKLLLIVPISLFITFVVTLLTAPESDETLRGFYCRVGPGGWWKPEHRQGCTLSKVTDGLFAKLVWGSLFLVGGIFSLGFLFLGRWVPGVLILLLSVLGLTLLIRVLNREGLSGLGTEGSGK